MKISLVLPLGLVALATATSAQPLGDDLTTSRNDLPSELVARQCSGGCKCMPRITPGIYCGNCFTNNGVDLGFAITEGRVRTHVYQCNSNGGCCSYGKANDCDTSNARCASRRGFGP